MTAMLRRLLAGSLLFAAVLAGAQSLTTQKAAGKTAVAAALPGNATMAISWQREIPKAPPAPAKLYAETQTLVAVAEGMLYEKGGYYYNRMQIIPPLNIARSELDRVIGILDKIFGEAEKKFGIT